MSTHMSEHNGLNPAEIERLALLMEECGEVIQVIGKVLRHGYLSRHHDGGMTNMEALERELGDVRAAVEIMIRANDLKEVAIVEAHRQKWKKVWEWMHHQ